MAFGGDRGIAQLLYGGSTWKAAVAPIVVWSRQLWRAVSQPDAIGTEASITQLRAGFVRVASNAPRSWAEVRGPIGAMLMSMRRVGWTSVDGLAVQAGVLGKILIPSMSPAMLASILKDACTTAAEGLAASSLAAKFNDVGDRVLWATSMPYWGRGLSFHGLSRGLYQRWHLGVS